MTNQENSPVFSAIAQTFDFPSKPYTSAAKPQAVLVLGMHRSGTSALTRVISLLGAELPKQLLPAAEENASGFWESNELMTLHDKLLNSAGSCWHDWTPLNPNWYGSSAAAEMRQQLLKFLHKDFANAHLFVIKDPRICRFIPFWLETLKHFQAVPKVLIPVRNPLEVAASLKARNNFILAKSCLLWLRHVLDAERETRTLSRSVITYDALLQNWRSTVDKAGNDVDLTWPRLSHAAQVQIEQFLSSQQRHHSIKDSALQAHSEVVVWIRETYDVLLEMAHGDNNDKQKRRLDAIRQAFDQADQAFGPICTDQALALQRQRRENQRLRTALNKVQANVAEHVTTNQQLSAAVDTHSAHLEVLSQTIAKRDQRIEELSQKLAALQQHLGKSLQQRDQIAHEHARLKTQAERLSRQLTNRDYKQRQFDDNLKYIYQRLQERTVELERQKNLTDTLSHTLGLKETVLAQINRVLTLTSWADLNVDEKTQINALPDRVRELVVKNRQLQQLAAEAAAVRHQLQTFKHSWAWRLSAPLRCISWVSKWSIRLLNWAFTLQLRRNINHLRHVKLIRASGLFDESFYLSQNPDLLQSNVDPLWHFLSYGPRLGRDPNPLFATSYYLTTYPDVAKSRLNPLSHYVRFGTSQGFNPHPLFDTRHYLSENPKLAQTGINPLTHYLREATVTGHNPNPLFNTGYYLKKNPELILSRTNPLIHFLAQDPFGGKAPHPLFDPDYYLNTNPDVAKTKTNPLVHFLHHGGREGRNPNPLFDSSYYLDTNPDVRRSGVNPLVHFIEFGAGEQRNPSVLFDINYYLNSNPHIEKSNLNPLEHFLLQGGYEGCKPVPLFDPFYYLKRYPDVAASGENPLVHYLIHGKREGRTATPESAFQELQCHLPADRPVDAAVPANLMVDVIVPVYKGEVETRRCVISVLKAGCQTTFRLIIVNDASPDVAINDYLDDLRDEKVSVLENKENLGFVKSVNLGMIYAATHDVVLLNSDTEVADGWLDRLVQHAYSADDVGTVTPFSNNATICSYPVAAEPNPLPPHETVDSLSSAFYAANAGQSVDLPTAIGFCMYIRRRCLDQVGLFDAETFGKGYGEENDFCLKATALGWRHLLAADTFVFHKGESSFQSSATLAKQNALDIIGSMYPEYMPTVMAFIQRDPAKPYRIAATAARYRHSGLPVVLLISHDLGGGTKKHIDELAKNHHEYGKLLLVTPLAKVTGDVQIELSSMDPNDAVQLALPMKELDFLVDLLKSFGVSRVHVHHVLGIHLDVKQLIHRLQVPFDFTVHDYFSICPQINLISTDNHYCQEPGTAGCNRCIAALPCHGAHDIETWRKSHEWLFLQAERVICPSKDTADRCTKYHPEANLLTVPHEDPRRYQCASVNLAPLDKDENLRIAVLGAIGINKGVKLIISCAQRIALGGLPLEIHIIGYAGLPLPLAPETPLYETGEYQDDQLHPLIEAVDPHVIWFPAQWPETYSYTLSAALASARPLIIPNLGAFPERVSHRPWSWVVDWDASPIQLTKIMMRIRDQYLNTQ